MSPPMPDGDDGFVVESGCARCPDLAASRTCIAWGNGPLDADVVVVGEAPAAGNPEADVWRGGNHTGLAYTSRHSGRRIRTLFSAIGLGAQTYYTSAVKCFPSDGGGSNREPTTEERAACRDHLAAELDRIAPTAVVATGRHATESVLAFDGQTLGGFLDAALDSIPCPSLDATLVPILHPSYEAVWRSRLGYEADEYRRELAETLGACGVAVR